MMWWLGAAFVAFIFSFFVGLSISAWMRSASDDVGPDDWWRDCP